MPQLLRAAPWWLLAAVILLADFATKEIVRSQMPLGTSIPMTSFFNLVSVRNPGAAFSFLADAGGWQRYFFVTLALAVSVWLGWMLTQPQRRLDAFGFSAILGGALGNAYDRLAHAAVTDFLDFHVSGWHWPAFNGADIAICAGAFAIIVAAFKIRPPASSDPDVQPRTPS